jgi:hypothetical protein
MEHLAEEYENKLEFYKKNIENKYKFSDKTSDNIFYYINQESHLNDKTNNEKLPETINVNVKYVVNNN